MSGFVLFITEPIRNIHPNGGVRGGTIRLLPVDSKAKAKRSSLYPSQEPPAQTTPKLK